MKLIHFLLLLRPCLWKVISSDGASVEVKEIAFDDKPESAVKQLAEYMNEKGYAGQDVCLGLGSSMVYSSSINAERLPRRNRTTSLLYRLEEFIPLVAEQITAVFSPCLNGKCLGFAVRNDMLLPILKSLDTQDVSVAAICPEAMLALNVFKTEVELLPDYVIIQNSDNYEIFPVSQSQAIAWQSASSASQALRCVSIEMLNHPKIRNRPSVLFVGIHDDGLVELLKENFEIQKIDSDKNSYYEKILKASTAFTEGKIDTWLNLRVGQLTIKNRWKRVGFLARSAAVLMILLVIILNLMFMTKSFHYSSAADQYQALQVKEFKSLYPNTAVPTNIKSRMQSQLNLMRGTIGHGTEIPLQINAIDSLAKIASSLPDNIKLKIIEIQITPKQIVINGEVQTHTHAEIVAKSLQTGGFSTLPPQSERIGSGGVSMKINAEPQMPSEQKTGGSL